MPNLEVAGVRTFVGARHFEDSRDFYVALGWKLNWERDALAELELGGCPLFLQRYYHREWCENSMLHVTVEDAQAWYEHARAVIEEGSFSGPPRVNPPKEEDYGALVTYIWDPAGVLLHMAQPLGRQRHRSAKSDALAVRLPPPAGAGGTAAARGPRGRTR